jgi:hypothetical protein
MRNPLAHLLLLLSLSAPTLEAQIVYSKRSLSEPSAGMIESKLFGEWYRGSGVVARDPRLIYSCAHVFYENGVWANDYVFHRNYHKRTYPRTRDGAKPRGIRHFSSYTSSVSSFGSDSDQAFASDFTVLYGNSSFGPSVGWFANGASALKSGALKRIVGYPAEIDFTGAAGFCFQHSTGDFKRSAYRVRGSFYEFDNVSTGPGNSGGPVFVQDGTSGQRLLAGMLVSGSRRTAGVVALDTATHTLASYALGLKPKSQEFSNDHAFILKDGSSSFATRDIPVSGFTGTLESIRLSITLYTPQRGDLEVYLRSPGGKIGWITRKSGGSADDLVVSNLNLDATFHGGPANGVWRLYFRDSVMGNSASFLKASLRVTAL